MLGVVISNAMKYCVECNECIVCGGGGRNLKVYATTNEAPKCRGRVPQMQGTESRGQRGPMGGMHFRKWSAVFMLFLFSSGDIVKVEKLHILHLPGRVFIPVFNNTKIDRVHTRVIAGKSDEIVTSKLGIKVLVVIYEFYTCTSVQHS